MDKKFLLAFSVVLGGLFLNNCSDPAPKRPTYCYSGEVVLDFYGNPRCYPGKMERVYSFFPNNPDFSGYLEAYSEKVSCASFDKKEYDACVQEFKKGIDRYNEGRLKTIRDKATQLGLLGDHELIEYNGNNEFYAKLNGQFSGGGSSLFSHMQGSIQGEAGQKQDLLVMWNYNGQIIISTLAVLKLSIVQDNTVAIPTIHFKYDIKQLEDWLSYTGWSGNPNDLMENVVTRATLRISEKQLRKKIYFRLVNR
jgi:hypothetical protein